MHFANKTRITCANFELVTGQDGGADDGDCEDDDDAEEGVEASKGTGGSDAEETADGGYEEAPSTTAGSHGTAAPSAPPTASGGPDAGESFIPSAAALSTVSLLGALGAAVFAL